MNIFKKIDEHADLMGSMSEKVGVDWGNILTRNPEMTREYRNAVMTCTHCKDVGECKGWLEDNASASGAPDYCLNKDLLGRLSES